MIEQRSHHPYGSTKAEQGDAGDPFAYVGNEKDTGSGLSDFKARPYRPEVGIFLAPDPVAVFEGKQTTAYTYSEGDPIQKVDPEGEWPEMPSAMGMLARGFGAITEFLVGGNGNPDHGPPRLPSGGPGGVAGGVVSAATMRLAPVEENPSRLSVAGMEAGACMVPVADPAARLVSGTTVTGQPASRLSAGRDLALEGLAIVGSAVATLKGAHTPYGPALQEVSWRAGRARVRAESGATLYRIGTTLKSEAAGAQFWAFEHPISPGFAGRHGIPPENITRSNFIQTGRLRSDANFITRQAPGYGPHPGGAEELVCEPGGVLMQSFTTH